MFSRRAQVFLECGIGRNHSEKVAWLGVVIFCMSWVVLAMAFRLRSYEYRYGDCGSRSCGSLNTLGRRRLFYNLIVGNLDLMIFIPNCFFHVFVSWLLLGSFRSIAGDGLPVGYFYVFWGYFGGYLFGSCWFLLSLLQVLKQVAAVGIWEVELAEEEDFGFAFLLLLLLAFWLKAIFGSLFFIYIVGSMVISDWSRAMMISIATCSAGLGWHQFATLIFVNRFLLDVLV